MAKPQLHHEQWFPGEDAPHLTRLGFRVGDKGTHTSRTMMLDELTLLLLEVPAGAARSEYAGAIVEGNCLRKPTTATRKLTNQRLGELYGLDPSVPLFRVLRQFWGPDQAGRPLLALLLALARDPLLRATAEPVFRMHPGEELARQALTNALNEAVGGRFNPEILDKIVRNAASSWTQAGHLLGRSRKSRQRVRPTPLSVAFALLIGYVLGLRGHRLFESPWCRVFDASVDELIFTVMDAKRTGYIDLKHAGSVIEVGFSGVLTNEERQLSYGTT
ncbi:MAG: hypothetical protein WD749_08730 [Phycisphaerales bacterium]